MARTYTHRAIARGGYPFPVDMLRYDRCYPRTEEDAGRLEELTSEMLRAERGRHSYEIVVEAVSESRVAPWTPRRWASFGWSLEAVAS